MQSNITIFFKCWILPHPRINNVKLWDVRFFFCFYNYPILYRFFSFFKVVELYCEWKYLDQKILRTLACDIQKHWTVVSILLGLISSIYHDLPTRDWTSDHRMQSSHTLPWLVDLASLRCDMNRWLSGRVLILHSVVTGSISSGGDDGIHNWWDLIGSKQLSSVSVC